MWARAAATSITIGAALAVSGCGSSSGSGSGSAVNQTISTATAPISTAPPGGGGFAGEAQGPSASPGVTALIAHAKLTDAAGYRFAVADGAQIVPFPGQRTFAVFSSRPAHPRALIVSLHGHDGNVFSQYQGWQPYLVEHGYGVVAVEWQLRFGDGAAFLDPESIYAVIRQAAARARIAPGRVLLHGFSQSAFLSFELTAIDRTRQKLFAETIAESGGGRDAASDPALAGTRWILYCAGRDQYAYLTGCGRMRDASARLTAAGARVDSFLVNPAGRHGSFLHDRPLVERALADFASVLAGR